MKKMAPHIYLIEDSDLAVNPELVPDMYYFLDETYDLHGPYPTSFDVEAALDDYCVNLNL